MITILSTVKIIVTKNKKTNLQFPYVKIVYSTAEYVEVFFSVPPCGIQI